MVNGRYIGRRLIRFAGGYDHIKSKMSAQYENRIPPCVTSLRQVGFIKNTDQPVGPSVLWGLLQES